MGCQQIVIIMSLLANTTK